MQEFFGTYVDVLKKYATFSGRARRKEYWTFFLINFLIGFVLGVLNIGWLSSLYSLFVLIPGLAVAVRRMHDIDKSAWWFVCLGVLPMVLLMISAIITLLSIGGAAISQMANPYAMIDYSSLLASAGWLSIIALIALVAAIWLLVLLCKEGTKGDNKYGKDPKALSSEAGATSAKEVERVETKEVTVSEEVKEEIVEETVEINEENKEE